MSRKHIRATVYASAVLALVVGCATDTGSSPSSGRTSVVATTTPQSAITTQLSPENEPVPSTTTQTIAPPVSSAPVSTKCAETDGWNTEQDTAMQELSEQEAGIPNRPLLESRGVVVTSDDCFDTVQFNFATAGRVGFQFGYSRLDRPVLSGSFFAPADPIVNPSVYNRTYWGSEMHHLRGVNCNYSEGYIDCSFTLDRVVRFAVEHQPRGISGPLDIVTIRFAR